MTIEHRPFSNGTEEAEWTNLWCGFCDHDHTMHSPEPEGGCRLVLSYLCDELPDEWTQPPSGQRTHLPSLMQCSKFTVCTECGDGGPVAVQLRARPLVEAES